MQLKVTEQAKSLLAANVLLAVTVAENAAIAAENAKASAETVVAITATAAEVTVHSVVTVADTTVAVTVLQAEIAEETDLSEEIAEVRAHHAQAAAEAASDAAVAVTVTGHSEETVAAHALKNVTNQ